VKLLKRVALVVLAGLLLLGVAAWLFAGKLAKSAVERAGTHALGVRTELGSLHVGLFAGELDLSDLSIENPEGFEEPHFLELDEGRFEVALGTLTEQRIEAPLLELSGLELALEKREGRTNYGVILERLKQISGGKAPEAPPEDEGGKTFIVHEVVIRDITARVDLLAVGGDLSEVVVTLPELRFHELGEGGAPLSAIVAEVVRAVLAAVVEAGAGRIPEAVLDELEGGLAQIREGLDELGTRAGQVLDEIGVGEGLEKASGAVEDALEEAGGVLDEVFGGDDE
jgi:hypothetical protein